MIHDRIPNIDLIKATIREVKADENFNMFHWDRCIYAAACRAAGEERMDFKCDSPIYHGARMLGIGDYDALRLFTVGDAKTVSKTTALRRLRALIPAPVVEPELAF